MLGVIDPMKATRKPNKKGVIKPMRKNVLFGKETFFKTVVQKNALKNYSAFLPFKLRCLLNYSLCQHCIGYFHKTSNVCSFDIVYRTLFIFSVLYTRIVNVLHNVFQLGIYLFTCPTQTQVSFDSFPILKLQLLLHYLLSLGQIRIFAF